MTFVGPGRTDVLPWLKARLLLPCSSSTLRPSRSSAEIPLVPSYRDLIGNRASAAPGPQFRKYNRGQRKHLHAMVAALPEPVAVMNACRSREERQLILSCKWHVYRLHPWNSEPWSATARVISQRAIASLKAFMRSTKHAPHIRVHD